MTNLSDTLAALSEAATRGEIKFDDNYHLIRLRCRHCRRIYP